jgi:hypothetical protein
MRKAAPTHARLHTRSRAHARVRARARARAHMCAAQPHVCSSTCCRRSTCFTWGALASTRSSVRTVRRALTTSPPGNPSLHALTHCQLAPCVMYLTPLQHELRQVSAPLQRRCSHGASASDDAPRPAAHRLRAAVLSATSAQLHAPPEHTTVGPIPVQMSGANPVPARARYRCRCGRGEPSPGADSLGAHRTALGPLRIATGAWLFVYALLSVRFRWSKRQVQIRIIPCDMVSVAGSGGGIGALAR